MGAAEEYRQHAAECLRAAEMAKVPDVKATLLSMAEHWNEIARRMEWFAETVTPPTQIRTPRPPN
jgi:hypothetical protein